MQDAAAKPEAGAVANPWRAALGVLGGVLVLGGVIVIAGAVGLGGVRSSEGTVLGQLPGDEAAVATAARGPVVRGADGLVADVEEALAARH